MRKIDFHGSPAGGKHIAACNKSIAQAERLRNERQNLHLEMA